MIKFKYYFPLNYENFIDSLVSLDGVQWDQYGYLMFKDDNAVRTLIEHLHNMIAGDNAIDDLEEL